MFFMLPFLPFLAIYIAAAVLPAAILLRYIYRTDTVEKEPAGLLLLLLVMGVVAALCSGILEMLGETVLNALVDPGSPVYTILLAFLVVALVEEGNKFIMLKKIYTAAYDRNLQICAALSQQHLNVIRKSISCNKNS